MASIDIAPLPAPDTVRAEGVWSNIRYHAASHPLGVIGAAIMVVFVFAAIFADFITSFDPIRTNSAITLLPPSHLHWLGADQMGRDIYSRIVYGARISLAVGIGSTLLGSVVRRRRSVSPPAISAAGSIWWSSASSTCCRPCRFWCWRW